MKTKKQIRKETIVFCETFGTGKKLSKKDIKYHMKFHINLECEKFLKTNGIEVVKEPTFKELSSYKKKIKKIKLSSKEKKIFKVYFKKKKESAKNVVELCKFLKKINMTLEEFDNIPLETDEKIEAVKVEAVIVEEVKVESVEEVKVEEVKNEKIISEEV